MYNSAPDVIWFTGLSGSGKTTLALALKERLMASGITRIYHLDGDPLRKGINSDLGFSLPAMKTCAALLILPACFSMQATGCWHLLLRLCTASKCRCGSSCRKGCLWKYIWVPRWRCQQRDPKQLYARAEAGQVADMTGVRSPYEPPQSPELRLNTARLSLESCMDVLMSSLAEQEGSNAAQAETTFETSSHEQSWTY